MYAVKARFDGQKVIVPDEVRGFPAGDVIIVFADGAAQAERASWLKAQESVFAETWHNDEDAAYGDL